MPDAVAADEVKSLLVLVNVVRPVVRLVNVSVTHSLDLRYETGVY